MGAGPVPGCAPRQAQVLLPGLRGDRPGAGAGLLAHVLVSKYADHLPLYRQAEILARDGVELSRSPPWPIGWASARRCCARLWTRWNGASWRVQCCTPTTRPCRCSRRGRAEPNAPPAVLYRYTPYRRGEHPRGHLAGFRGVLQADGYAGFAGLYAGEVAEAACWAHVRRKFFDIHAAGQSPLATKAVQRINALYAVERDIAGRPPVERAETRKARAGPALDALHAWLTTTLARIPGRGDLASAIRYALSRWTELTRYRDDGRVAIDNNAAERAISPKRAAFAAGPLVLGRKNWLFAGSDAGGHRAAAIASLLETAKLNGIDPAAYLRHVLGTIADHPVSRVAELLPWAINGLPSRLNQT